VSPSSASLDRLAAAGGLLVVGLLVLFALGTILGIAGAIQGAFAAIMLGAGFLGVRALLDGGVVGLSAGVLLVISGALGGWIALTGGSPFEHWPVIGPMAVGVALTYYRDRP